MRALKRAVVQFSSYRHFLDGLSRSLATELPGTMAQHEMAPPHRLNEQRNPAKKKTYLEAAVLALFYPEKDAPDEAKLLLTVRTDGMAKHAGQIAFPGGRRETGEDLVDTALRETDEEVAIPKQLIEILGALTPLYIPLSNFCVYPFVGAIDTYPDMAAASEEVASIFGVSVPDLVDPALRRTVMRDIREKPLEIPYFALNGEFVWGATAMMLAELVAVLRSIEPQYNGLGRR